MPASSVGRIQETYSASLRPWPAWFSPARRERIHGRDHRVKNALLRMLGRTRLLAPTYRAYERLRAARLPHAPEPAPADGLPVPPAHLIVRVAGTPDAAWFLESGRLAAQSIRDVLERAGTRVEAMES